MILIHTHRDKIVNVDAPLHKAMTISFDTFAQDPAFEKF